MHHEIVALERIHQPLPESWDFPPSTTYNLTVYERPDASLVHERVRDATILIITTTKISAETLSPEVTPKLQYIAVMASGVDPVDLGACRKRGIRVTNCPAANLDSVSEHAISLYFAARRRTVMLDRATRQVPSDWKTKKTLTGRLRFADGEPPLSCGDEVMGVVGYGALGKRIAALGKALGMKVLIAARKTSAASTPSSEGLNGVLPPPTLASTSEDRVPFADVLRRSTVLVLSLPRNPQTMNLLSTPEFSSMSPHAVLVNIARGGIVDEKAIIQALKDGQIAGYATDVLEKEPAEGPEDSVLLGEEASELNITVSPHLAWFAQRTLKNLGAILKETMEAWVEGKELNVIV